LGWGYDFNEKRLLIWIIGAFVIVLVSGLFLVTTIIVGRIRLRRP
jgi:hypothetical protein